MSRSAPGSKSTSPMGGSTTDFSQTPDERKAVPEGVGHDALRGRLDLCHLAQGVRRQGPFHDGGGRAQRGVPPCGCADAGRLLRRHPRRSRPSCSGGPRSRRRTSSPRSSPARSPGVRASASPTPAPTSPGSRPRPSSTATSGSSTGRRSGPPRRSLPTTSSSSAEPTRTRRSTRASRYLLCPMKQEGIEVRPIEQVDGSAEFCEVFFTDARCPKENVVGGVNNGWKVAMTTLGFERGTSATTGHRRFEKELEQHHRRRPAPTAASTIPPSARVWPRPTARCRSCASTGCVASRRWFSRRRTRGWRPSAPPTRCSGASTTAT